MKNKSVRTTKYLITHVMERQHTITSHQLQVWVAQMQAFLRRRHLKKGLAIAVVVIVVCV